MRRRYFTITDNMLDAGEHALWTCHEEGGHNAQSVCRIVFRSMLDAAYTHPGVATRPVMTRVHAPISVSRRARNVAISQSRLKMPLLDGSHLPQTIWHPDDFPSDKLLRRAYWYLHPRYDATLRNLLRNPATRAKLKFHKPA